MRKPERMIVPFDGSEAAEHLLRYACRVALDDYATLTVLCVVKLPADGRGNGSIAADEASVMHALVRAQQLCREEGVVATFHYSYATDLPTAILAEAQRLDAALIAVSLDGHQPGDTALMSPDVQRVLAASPRSVLVVDPAAELPARR